MYVYVKIFNYSQAVGPADRSGPAVAGERGAGGLGRRVYSVGFAGDHRHMAP